MAWIQLTKSFEIIPGKRLPMGSIANVSRAKYKEIMEAKVAEDYNGNLPPKQKTKTNFFNPKK